MFMGLIIPGHILLPDKRGNVTKTHEGYHSTTYTQELGWPSLKTRREYFSLVLLYKMTNGLTPAYLQSLLPPKQGHHSRYPSRRRFNFIPIRTNKVKYYKSFFPATVRSWNNLDDNMKQLPIPGHFKNVLKNSLFPKHVKYFSHCKGAAAVNHTRMRLGLGHLRQQLHTHHIVETPYCLHSCCHQKPESTDHYLLQCPKYAASRELLLRGLGPTVDRLGINTSSDLINLLLNGHQDLSFQENINLLVSVQLYIKNTGRF